MAIALTIALTFLLFGCAARPHDDGAAVAEGSNSDFQHTVETTATPEALWALWTDVPRWPQWDTELEEAALDGPFREGAEGRLTSRGGPPSRFRIEDVDPGRAYTLATRLPLGALRVRRTWSPTQDGRIAVTHAVTFTGVGGRLLSGRLGPPFRRALPTALGRLVTLAETASAGRTS